MRITQRKLKILLTMLALAGIIIVDRGIDYIHLLFGAGVVLLNLGAMTYDQEIITNTFQFIKHAPKMFQSFSVILLIWFGIFSIFVAGFFLSFDYRLILGIAAILLRFINDYAAARQEGFWQQQQQQQRPLPGELSMGENILLHNGLFFGPSMVSLWITFDYSIPLFIALTVAILTVFNWFSVHGKYYNRGYVFVSWSKRRDPVGKIAMDEMFKILKKYNIKYFDYNDYEFSTEAKAEIFENLQKGVYGCDCSIEIVNEDIGGDFLDKGASAKEINNLLEAEPVSWLALERCLLGEHRKKRFLMCLDDRYPSRSDDEKHIERHSFIPPLPEGKDEFDSEYQEDKITLAKAYFGSAEFRDEFEKFVVELKTSRMLGRNTTTTAAIEQSMQDVVTRTNRNRRAP